MAISLDNSTISTYVDYKGHNYQCFGLTDDTTASIEFIRTSIAAAVEVPALLSDDIVEIKTDDGNYVTLNNYYLINKYPWKSCFNAQQLSSPAKPIILRIVPKTEPKSITYPALVAKIQFANETEINDYTATSATNKNQQMFAATSHADIEEKFLNNGISSANDVIDNSRLSLNYSDLTSIEQFRDRLQNSLTPLKFIYDVNSSQRLVYPSGLDSVLIQTEKRIEAKKGAAHPVLQISNEYVDFLRAGGSVELISAVVNKGVSQNKSLSYYLAAYRGFWPTSKASRPEPDTPFSNPLISPIMLNQLQEMKTNAGESIYTVKLNLRLMYAVGTKYDQNPQPLVLFNELFLLSGAQSVPSYYNFSPYPAVSNANVQEILNKNECYIWCALRSDPQCDFQDFYSTCLSKMFTVEPRTSSNATRSADGPRSTKRSRTEQLE